MLPFLVIGLPAEAVAEEGLVIGLVVIGGLAIGSFSAKEKLGEVASAAAPATSVFIAWRLVDIR